MSEQNKRGRAYSCRKCEYMGEKSKVENHFHKMHSEGGEKKKLTDADIERKSKVESEDFFQNKKRKEGKLEDIIPDMLCGQALRSPSLSISLGGDLTPPRIPAPFKGPRSPALSLSSVSTYQSTQSHYKCASCKDREQENAIVKQDIVIMGQALSEMVKELNEIKEIVKSINKPRVEQHQPAPFRATYHPYNRFRNHTNNYNKTKFQYNRTNYHNKTTNLGTTLSQKPNTHIFFD